MRPRGLSRRWPWRWFRRRCPVLGPGVGVGVGPGVGLIAGVGTKFRSEKKGIIHSSFSGKAWFTFISNENGYSLQILLRENT